MKWIVISSPKSILPIERMHTNRETQAASSDTHACIIIIISDAFNNLSLSFEDNPWGILNLTISFALIPLR